MVNGNHLPAMRLVLLLLMGTGIWIRSDEARIEAYSQIWQTPLAQAATCTEMGNDLTKAKLYEQAQTWFQKALKLDPQFGAAHFGLAFCLIDQGNLEAAIPHLDQVITSDDPLAADAHNTLGSILENRQQDKQARHHFSQALVLNPKLVAAHYNLGLLALRHHENDAASHFQAVLALEPNHLLAHLQLGRIALASDQAKQAEPHFLAMLRINPQSPFAHYNLGLARQALGDRRQASSHFRQALQLKPDLAPAARELAWLLATQPDEHQRNPQEALLLAKELCERSNYQNPLFLDTLAAAQAAAGLFPEAVTSQRTALDLFSRQNQTPPKDWQDRLKLYQQGRPYVTP